MRETDLRMRIYPGPNPVQKRILVFSQTNKYAAARIHTSEGIYQAATVMNSKL
jgi:hypothetical protein